MSAGASAADLDWMVGRSVRLKTVLGEEFEGLIFACDVSSGCVVLETCAQGCSPSDGFRDFRILKTSVIADVELVSSQSTSVIPSVSSSLPPLNLRRIANRQHKALRAWKQELGRIGVGVTPEGQRIFDALYKTMPCRWRDQTILVFEDQFSVQIPPPYSLESVSGTDESSVLRVKKVLEGEKRKLIVDSGRE